MDPVQGPGPWTRGPRFVLSRQSDITDEQLDSKVRAFLNEHGCLSYSPLFSRDLNFTKMFSSL